MSNFKVGDRVEVTENYEAGDRLLIGERGKVIHEGNYGVSVNLDQSGVGFFYDKELRLCEPTTPVKLIKSLLPADASERKKYPIVSGVLDYFPSALLEVSRVSYMGNQQHNPGQPLHWARGKSTDQTDTTIRHFMERDVPAGSHTDRELTKDMDGTYHMAKACWRMLAEFQLMLEKEGAPLARGARLPEEKK